MLKPERVRVCGEVLKNRKNPLKLRFRALFTLKNIGCNDCVSCIAKCFSDKSALLKHELAYCLGQMRNKSAVDILIDVLKDETQEIVVRHEAAEALGAIEDLDRDDVFKVLEYYQKCDVEEISETCELALHRFKYFATGKKYSSNIYGSVDPAPPLDENNVQVLEELYLNENESIFVRYQAMFALRNRNDLNSTRVIIEGFRSKSALFRHEVAFVLGQLQRSESIPALKDVVSNSHENNMVRHEAIEALGSIGSPECMEIIQMYLNDEDDLVRESCEVALDIHTYQNSTEFQYAFVSPLS